MPGDTIDGVARVMLSNGQFQHMSPSVKRALLLHNNPVLLYYVVYPHLPNGLTLNVTPALLSDREIHFWKAEAPVFENWIRSLDPYARGIYEDTDPQTTLNLAKIMAQLRAAGAAVGIDDRVDVAGAAVNIVDGGAAASLLCATATNALVRELYADAVQKLGVKVVTSSKANHIQQMVAFFKAHPKYPMLNQHLRDLPRLVVTGAAREGAPYWIEKVTPQIARHMRKQYWLALSDRSSSRYMGTIASQLNGRVSLLKTAGRATTWYIPAAIGLYNVANAPSEMRMRTLFAEGFGVIGGAIGTQLGISAGLGAVKLLALAGLCIGPWGAFILVAFLAAGVGFAASYAGRRAGGELVYDYGAYLGNQLFYSIDELLDQI